MHYAMLEAHELGVVDKEVEVSTSWGFPESIDPESVFLFHKDDFALSLESDAKTRKPVLCKLKQHRPVYTLGNFLNSESYRKIDRFYSKPDYREILHTENKQINSNKKIDRANSNSTNQRPTSLNTSITDDDVHSVKSNSSNLSQTKQSSSSSPKSVSTNCSSPKGLKLQSCCLPKSGPLNTVVKEEPLDSPPMTTYKDLGLRDTTGAYICIHCPITFLSMNDMRSHCANEHNAKPFRCKICSRMFNSARSLLVHTFCHTGEKHYKCPYCDETFRQMGHKNSHVKIFHDDSMPFKCDECPDLGFKSSFDLGRHRKKDHFVPRTKCSACFRNFANPNQLKVHECVKRVKNLNCGACGEKFYRMKDVLTHAKFCKFVDESDVKCEKCGTVFPTAAKCSVHKTYLCTGVPIENKERLENMLFQVKKELVDYDDVVDMDPATQDVGAESGSQDMMGQKAECQDLASPKCLNNILTMQF